MGSCQPSSLVHRIVLGISTWVTDVKVLWQTQNQVIMSSRCLHLTGAWPGRKLWKWAGWLWETLHCFCSGIWEMPRTAEAVWSVSAVIMIGFISWARTEAKSELLAVLGVFLCWTMVPSFWDFPGCPLLTLEDRAIVYTNSRLVHLWHLFPHVNPHLMPCVLDPKCQLGSLS